VTAGTIQTRNAKRGLLASATAWVWPQPLRTDDRPAGAWMGPLAAWLWPSRLENESFGRRHGLMASLFGWMWPQGLDRGMQRWWRASWLWSWMWPGRVMGPNGEICPLAPWHPAARPEVLASDPWQKKVGRHGGAMAMMFAATAIAAPTFMEGNSALDGGRLNLFRGGGATQDDAPNGGEQTTPTDGGAPGDDAGGPDGGAGDGGAGPGGGDAGGGPNNDFGPPDVGGTDGGTDGALLGGTGGPGPGDPGGGGGDDAGGSDPTMPTGGGDDLTPDPGLVPDGDNNDAGAGGGGAVGGGSGGGGGGGGSGGGQPTDPNGGNNPNPGNPGGNPSNPDSPFTPPNPPTDKPVFPTIPGGEPGPGGGPTGPSNQLLPRGDGGDDRGPTDIGETRPTTPVPEPATWAMMILGFGAVGYAIRRRRFAASVS